MYVYTAASQLRRWYTLEGHTKIKIIIMYNNFFSILLEKLLF